MPTTEPTAKGSTGSCPDRAAGARCWANRSPARGGSHRANYRKLPGTSIGCVDQLNSIRPRRDVEAAGRTEVEQHRPGMVQQSEDPQRAVGSDQVEIGHTVPEQRVSLAEVVMN